MKRVLIVDDNAANAYYLESLLTLNGFDVQSAVNGAEALVVARENPPDLVVSDLLMPVMDGYSLLRQWKADAVLVGVPFIVYTATYTTAEDERLAFNLGADAFIIKPTAPEAFLDQLREVEVRASATTTAKPREAPGADNESLREYSEALIRKLEEKTLQLEATVAHLSNVLDYSLDVICSFDADGRFVRVNAAGESVFGHRIDEMLGQTYIENVIDEDIDSTLAAVAAARAGQPVRNFENRCRRSNGAVAHLQWTLHWSDEEQIMFCVGRDITETRSLEVQVLRAQRMETAGTLAGGIAHDLNNVLAPIIMSIGLLQMDDRDPRRLDILQVIDASAHRGADLAKQLLSFTSRAELEHVGCPVGELLAEVGHIVEETFLKTIEVRLEVVTDLWVVEGDPTQLHQVLLNLCVNARDAMPNGGILTLSARNLELDEHDAARLVGAHAGAYVAVTVQDTGTGMSSDVLDRAFEPFFTTKDVGKGTGLGLSTTLAIVKRHGGFVRASSEVGTGTIITVLLPANPAVARPRSEPTGGSDPIRGTGECVLVVDDDAGVRQITERTLQAYGYRALPAVDGAEAMQLFKKYRRDIALVITDMMMPRTAGPSLIAALLIEDPDAKIIAMSGVNSSEVVRTAKDLGAARFLAKPFSAGVLLRTLHDLLGSDAEPGTFTH